MPAFELSSSLFSSRISDRIGRESINPTWGFDKLLITDLIETAHLKDDSGSRKRTSPRKEMK